MLEYRIERKLTWQKNAEWHHFCFTSETKWEKQIARLRSKQTGTGVKYRAVCGHFVVRTELE